MTRGSAPDAKTVMEPAHWIILADHRQVHVYKKTRDGIVRLPEESLCCSLPVPGEEADDKSFLADICLWLAAAEREGAFDRIALIAPQDALEELRAHLSANVTGRLCAARSGDIAEISENEIEDHLADVMWL